jgi:hypothetical protein
MWFFQEDWEKGHANGNAGKSELWRRLGLAVHHMEARLGEGAVLPATYTIDTDLKLVVTRIWGAATEDEIFDHGQRLRNDPQFRPDFRQLVDMRGLTEIRVGSGVIRDASRNQFFSPGVRRAVVANSDASFGMARMYAIASEMEGQTIEVFRDINVAEAWLNVQSAQ